MSTKKSSNIIPQLPSFQQAVNSVRSVISNCIEPTTHKYDDYKIGNMRLDMFLSAGCKKLGWEGKTAIEFKWGYQADIFVYLKTIYDTCQLDTLVVFFNEYSRSQLSKYTEGTFDEVLPGRRIVFVSYEKFLEDHAEKEANSNDYTSTPQAAIIKEAKTDARKNKCTLFIGAGVSSSCGMVGWDDLLKEMISAKRANVNYEEVFKQCGWSELVTARYIKDILYGQKEKEFRDKLREILYKYDIKPDSDCIKILQAYILKRKRIDIITFNYDSLLDEIIQDTNLKTKTIFDDITREKDTDVSIYHVHGYVSRNEDKGLSFVLDENQYHQLYNNPFHWSNVVQLYALRNSVCFFIGLSMNDPNLRRLLDAAMPQNKEGIWHYAFMSEPESQQEEKYVMEKMLADFRIRVLWYSYDKEHSQLPVLMKAVFGV